MGTLISSVFYGLLGASALVSLFSAPFVAAQSTPPPNDSDIIYEKGDSLLTAYISEALTNHPDLASMQAMVEAESSRVSMAGSWMNPNLMLGLMSLPTSFDFHEESMTSKEIGFMIRIPFPGKLRSAKEAQIANVVSARYDYEQMRWDMTAMVRMAYYDLAGNLEVQTALLEGKRLAGDMVTAAQIMASSEMGSQADILRAQLQYDQWRKRIIENEQRIQVSRSRLAAAMGRTSADDLQNPATLSEPPALPKLKTLLDAYLAEVPSRKSQKARLESSQASVRRADLDYWPDVDFTFKYGFRDYLQAGAMGGDPMMITPLDNMISLEASLPVPLFYRSNQKAMIQENKAMAAKAQADYLSGDIKLRDEVRQGYARLETARRTFDLIADTLLPGAEATFRASLTDYQSGRLPFMSLNEALMQVVMQKMDRTMALADIYMAVAELERLLARPLP